MVVRGVLVCRKILKARRAQILKARRAQGWVPVELAGAELRKVEDGEGGGGQEEGDAAEEGRESRQDKGEAKVAHLEVKVRWVRV